MILMFLLQEVSLEDGAAHLQILPQELLEELSLLLKIQRKI